MAGIGKLELIFLLGIFFLLGMVAFRILAILFAARRSPRNDKRNRPSKKEQRNFPSENEQRNLPSEKEQWNLPLENDHWNLPLENDPRYLPLENDQWNLPSKNYARNPDLGPCPYCGQSVSLQVKICPHCSVPMKPS